MVCKAGGVVVHFILCIYAMLMIGNVVDEYFVPSLEIIAEGRRSLLPIIAFYGTSVTIFFFIYFQ